MSEQSKRFLIVSLDAAIEQAENLRDELAGAWIDAQQEAIWSSEGAAKEREIAARLAGEIWRIEVMSSIRAEVIARPSSHDFRYALVCFEAYHACEPRTVPSHLEWLSERGYE